jgi:hypothetical protein
MAGPNCRTGSIGSARGRDPVDIYRASWWICSLAGAGLAFAMLAGPASGLTRRMDLFSAPAVLPLPAIAIYSTSPELYAAIRPGARCASLSFPVGHSLLE